MMIDETKNRRLITLIGLLVLMLFTFGCNIQKKQIRKAKETMFSYPDSFANQCSILFPIKENFIKGKDNFIEKTLTVKGDSIPCPNINGVQNKVKCPDKNIIYRNIIRVDTIVKESTSKLQDLQNKFNALQADKLETDKKLEAKTEQSENRLWTSISLGVALIGVLWILIKR
jgi:hypothetical protein